MKEQQSSIRNIKTIISIRAGSTGLASLRSSIDRSNLISVPLQPPHKSVHHRQLLSNFALINSRSIRNKTLMLKDYIIEHDLDILRLQKLGSMMMIILMFFSAVTFVLLDLDSIMILGRLLRVVALLYW